MGVWADVSHLLERPRLYSRILTESLLRGGCLDLVRSRFPFFFSDPPFPRTIGLELTNVCNLRCAYCPSQRMVGGPRGFMVDATLGRLVSQLRTFQLQTLRVIGGGEPTLHPQFIRYVESLRDVARVLTLTTNGQALSRDTIKVITTAFDFVEISVDGCDGIDYEQRRVGGRFGRLLHTIETFRTAAAQSHSSVVLGVRIMLRLSDSGKTDMLRRFWRQYAEAVRCQPLLDRGVGCGGLFPAPARVDRRLRRCETPFKSLGVGWDGAIRFCSTVAERLPQAELAAPLGNILHNDIVSIWRGPVLRRYRDAHRRLRPAGVDCCVGCGDATSLGR